MILEVTEGMLVLRDDEPDAAFLVGLKELGVKLSIDDFGTGYCSLSYLKRLPADSLKLDGSFVSGLGADPHDEAIVEAVVSLAHALGMCGSWEKGWRRPSSWRASRSLGATSPRACSGRSRTRPWVRCSRGSPRFVLRETTDN